MLRHKCMQDLTFTKRISTAKQVENAIEILLNKKILEIGTQANSESRQSERSMKRSNVEIQQLVSSSGYQTQLHEGNVPQRERKIKDIHFLILLAVVLSGLGYLAYYALKNGNPLSYYRVLDSWGNICGRENDPISKVTLSGRDQTLRKFRLQIGLTNRGSENQSPAICVSECPTHLTKSSCQTLLQQHGYDRFSNAFIDANICVIPSGVMWKYVSLVNDCLPKQVIEVS